MIKLWDVVNRDLFYDMQDKHYIISQSHPMLPLRVFNYSKECQYEGVWNPVTNICRGLILDDNDNIIARPFSKFHNINTSSIPETMEENLPKRTPDISKKLDGSLGIYWEYDGWRDEGHCGIATRGSFTSDQAKWATAKVGSIWPRKWHWPLGYTPLFEIIYKENRIVIDYDFEDIVLLGMVNKVTGEEISRPALELWGKENQVQVVPVVEASSIKVLPTDVDNEEGYVVTWHKGFQPPLKVKIKFEEYCRLHRVLTGMNPKDVWGMLSEGKWIQINDLMYEQTLPESFKKWLCGWVNKLNADFNTIVRQATAAVDVGSKYSTRRETALYFEKTAPDVMGVCFSMLDNKDYKKLIWKMVKPKGNDKSFLTEE